MTHPNAINVHGAGDLGVRRVRRAVQHVLAGERRVARIDVTFLGPRRMRQLNAHHLGHDAVTDVIAFALPQPGGSLNGDVYVCRLAAVRNARDAQLPVRQELLRLVVHGTLHVLGHDHATGADRTRGNMWRRQESYVAALTCAN